MLGKQGLMADDGKKALLMFKNDIIVAEFEQGK